MTGCTKTGGDWNSGYRNSGDYNSGNWNNGYRNSGDWNSGDWNSGYNNGGYRNSGSYNDGDWNSGNCNEGDCNSGNCNSGNCNSGEWNSGNRHSGIFNTDERPKIKIFDTESDWTMMDWFQSKAYAVMTKCPHTHSEFIDSSFMSDEEKANHPEYKTIGGYIRDIVVDNNKKQEWWDALSSDKRQAVYDLPNFDAEKFRMCTGITVEDKERSKYERSKKSSY